MKRIILIDGNNLLFRSYYATAYNGNFMKNSKDFPTNAVFGFLNMINKIMEEEKPTHVCVAFDIGKNFRHDLYKTYKDGRIETPKELQVQFPLAKNILNNLGIKYLEIENYEADDIIGTLVKMIEKDQDYDATIVSSDKDLLQLINFETDVKLLKQSGYILYDENKFKEDYGFNPIRIIDLKALMGDKSDNIPGVKGVGEKTALNLIQEYDTIENLYENIDNIKGKLQEKLLNDKESAFFSKKIATIYTNIDLNINLNDTKLNGINKEGLLNIFNDLEFYSFIKKFDLNNTKIKETLNKEDKKEKTKFIELKKDDKFNLNENYSFYLEVDNMNYHKSNIIGLSIYDGTNSYYIDSNNIEYFSEILSESNSTYDLKKALVVLNKYNYKIDCKFDTLIAGYLLNYNVKDDISYLSNIFNYNLPFYEELVGKKKKYNEEELKEIIVNKSKFIYEINSKLKQELNKEECEYLFNKIEMPLISVLSNMEIEGINVDINVLNNIKAEISVKLSNLEKDIFNLAGESFNISSPKQLGDILYEKLDLPHSKKKGKNGYSTNHDMLVKLIDMHPIINKILEYRNLNKIFTTYLDNLASYIMEDGKIHTIYKQCITRTGRLSSVEPNLQNIPVRSEEGKNIRKAFVPSKDCVILTSDYSQIELRVLAHISNCEKLIDAFNQHEDIHTKVASDIYGVPIEAVTKNMRRTAKSVIFGIVYGISGYGLSENLLISYKDAKEFIKKYYELYPGVKKYMEDIVIEAKEKEYVKTIFNRKRKIDELKNTNYIIRQMGQRIALNTPIQGSSADIMKLAMINVFNKMKKLKLKSKMILQVHDELVFDTYQSEKKELEKIVKDCMENVYKLKVPLKVEIDFGKDWYDAK